MIASNGRFVFARKLFSKQIGRFGRALGIEAKLSLPEKPAVRHALENLTFCNGTIYEMRNGRLFDQYLGLPEIEVVAKLSLRELVNEQCEYRFRLNAMPDPVWRCFFKKRLPEMPVRFESNVMVLTCPPANLEWGYHKAKEAMLQANLWYEEERDDLIPQIVARDDERRLAKELEQNRKNGLRRQFEGLQI